MSPFERQERKTILTALNEALPGGGGGGGGVGRVACLNFKKSRVGALLL